MNNNTQEGNHISSHTLKSAIDFAGSPEQFLEGFNKTRKVQMKPVTLKRYIVGYGNTPIPKAIIHYSLHVLSSMTQADNSPNYDVVTVRVDKHVGKALRDIAHRDSTTVPSLVKNILTNYSNFN